MQNNLSQNAINLLLSKLQSVFDVKNDTQLAVKLGVKQNTVSSWRSRGSADLSLIIAKCDNIEIDLNWLFDEKITNTNYQTKYAENVIVDKPNDNHNTNPNFPNVHDLLHFDDDNFTEVAIADISVAAGGGSANSDYYEVNGSIRLPKSMLRSNGTRMCVKVDGRSMEPTLPHASRVIIRLLDRNEWRNIKDDQVYVVTDREGGTYIKRCTNKLHSEGVIVLMSDNTAFAPITLGEDELHNIWVVELFLMFDLPNKRAEDDLWKTSIEGEVREIKQELTKVLRVINKDNLKRS